MHLKKDLKQMRAENDALRAALAELTSGRSGEASLKHLELLLAKSASISAPNSRLPSAGNQNSGPGVGIKLPSLSMGYASLLSLLPRSLTVL